MYVHFFNSHTRRIDDKCTICMYITLYVCTYIYIYIHHGCTETTKSEHIQDILKCRLEKIIALPAVVSRASHDGSMLARCPESFIDGMT